MCVRISVTKLAGSEFAKRREGKIWKEKYVNKTKKRRNNMRETKTFDAQKGGKHRTQFRRKKINL